jgi:hypothetical protein
MYDRYGVFQPFRVSVSSFQALTLDGEPVVSGVVGKTVSITGRIIGTTSPVGLTEMTWVFRAAGVSTTFGSIIWNAGPFYRNYVWLLSGGTQLRLATTPTSGTSATLWTWTLTKPWTNKLANYVVRWYVSGGVTYASLFVDGVDQGAGTKTAGTNPTAYPVHSGESWFGGNSVESNAILALGARIGRHVTDAEAQSLSIDPWQIFVPERKARFIPASGVTNLILSDATHSHTVDNLALSVSTALLPSDSSHSHTADNLALVASTNLVVSETVHGHTVDNVVLGLAGVANLIVADAAHAHTADTIALTLASFVTVVDALHSHTADNLTTSTQSNLSLADAIHAHTVDNVTLGLAGVTNLIVADSSHAHTVDNLTLTATAALIVNEATHAHTVDNVTLNTAGSVTLVPADAAHSHTADSVTLVVSSVLVVAEATHAHTVDNTVLTATTGITVAEARHTHTVDNLTLNFNLSTNLVVAETSHSHTADNVTTTLQSTVLISDATHSHTADTLTLGGTSTLTLGVDESLHSHSADTVIVDTSAALAISDATHEQTSENLTISVVTSDTLIVNFATHNSSSDNVSLEFFEFITLQIAEARHAHIADNPTFFANVSLTISETLHSVRSAAVTFGDIPKVLTQYGRRTRNRAHKFQLPDGTNVDSLRESVRRSFGEVHSALDDVANNIDTRWETLTLLGAWLNRFDAGFREPAARWVAPDLIVLRGVVEVEEEFRETPIGILPPPLTPLFNTQALAWAEGFEVNMAIPLSFYTNGTIVPIWQNGFSNTHVIYLENVFVYLK